MSDGVSIGYGIQCMGQWAKRSTGYPLLSLGTLQQANLAPTERAANLFIQIILQSLPPFTENPMSVHEVRVLANGEREVVQVRGEGHDI